MPAGPYEGDEVGGGDRGCRVVLERVKIEAFLSQHRRIEDDFETPRRGIDEREGSDGASLDAQHLGQQIGLAEAQPPRADHARYGLEVDAGILEADNEVESALLVLEEQVLGMGAGDLAAQALCFSDGEDRRVLARLGSDSEAGKAGHEIPAAGWHDRPIAFGKSLRNKRCAGGP